MIKILVDDVSEKTFEYVPAVLLEITEGNLIS